MISTQNTVIDYEGFFRLSQPEFYWDFLKVGNERINVLDRGRLVLEELVEKCSNSTSPLLMVLMNQPDWASSNPGLANIRFPGETWMTA
jgi:hypothetical protein